ncbi:PLP-dependent aminotransferase family protein [Pontibacterium sp.]|uniref:MocR-like pyridoxine biosynthesis transcription factor PdxR n=2 Tax=Pontibacterium sp. TaxID=2036026 RepID=UPI00351440D6
MASQFPSSLFLPFQESSSELAQYTRLFRAFQQAIINGDLTPGAKLPASRALCAELGISRNTVKTAYEMLHAEGYVETRHGAGSFVATNLPLDTVDQSEDQAQPQAQVPPKLSAMAQTLVGVRKPNQMKTGELLLPAQPCVNSFPWSQWQRAVASAGRQMKYQQNSVMGNSQLREQIANYLRVVRGVKCTTDQVMICSGSQQAMFLALKLLVDAGEAVIAEDPGYQGIDGAIAAVGATKIPAQVDKQGIQLEDGLQQAPNARVVMLTPSRNHPLGHTLSLDRRLQLLQWAKRNGSWLIEDDYDSEFRFEQQPLTSLQGLGGQDVVIYTGTFSRILHPGIRLGYMVLPELLLEPATRAKTYMEGGTSILPQLALAEFMSSGHFASHVRRMRKLYHQRREILHSAIDARLGAQLSLIPSDGGMHSVYLIPEQWDDRRIRQLCEARGLGIRDLSRYYTGQKRTCGLVIGFAGYSEAEINTGVDRLAAAIDLYSSE